MPILRGPVQEIGYFGDGVFRRRPDDLWNWFTFPKGIALVRRNGVWDEESAVQEDGADEYYLGGYTYYITQDQADELTAAGFGQYITPDDNPPIDNEVGFGDGLFGSGPFGD